MAVNTEPDDPNVPRRAPRSTHTEPVTPPRDFGDEDGPDLVLPDWLLRDITRNPDLRQTERDLAQAELDRRDARDDLLDLSAQAWRDAMAEPGDG